MYGADAVPCSESIPPCQPTGQHNLKYHIKTFAHRTDTYTHVLLTYSGSPRWLSSFFHASSDRERIVLKASATFTLPHSYSLSPGCVQLDQERLTLCGGGKNLTLSFGSCVDKSIIVLCGSRVSP